MGGRGERDYSPGSSRGVNERRTVKARAHKKVPNKKSVLAFGRTLRKLDEEIIVSGERYAKSYSGVYNSLYAQGLFAGGKITSKHLRLMTDGGFLLAGLYCTWYKLVGLVGVLYLLARFVEDS